MSSIAKAIGPLVNIALLLLFAIIIFAIVGLEFYSGALNKTCYDIRNLSRINIINIQQLNCEPISPFQTTFSLRRREECLVPLAAMRVHPPREAMFVCEYPPPARIYLANGGITFTRLTFKYNNMNLIRFILIAVKLRPSLSVS